MDGDLTVIIDIKKLKPLNELVFCNVGKGNRRVRCYTIMCLKHFRNGMSIFGNWKLSLIVWETYIIYSYYTRIKDLRVLESGQKSEPCAPNLRLDNSSSSQPNGGNDGRKVVSYGDEF